MDLRDEYREELDQLKGLPEYSRAHAEARFLTLREFQDHYRPREIRWLRKAYREKKATVEFCRQKSISYNTFLRWKSAYKQDGIEGLIPRFGSKHRETTKAQLIRDLRQKGPTDEVNGPVIIDLEIPAQHPLDCLKKIRETIASSGEIPLAEKGFALTLLDQVILTLRTKQPLQLSRPLTKEEISQLKAYQAGTHKRHSTIATALLLINEGCHLADVSLATGRTRTTIYRWIRRFKDTGLDFVVLKPASSARASVHAERTQRVRTILHAPPSAFGINRTSWTYPTIREAYESEYGTGLPSGALQRIIRESGYKWRRARTVLTSPDSQYKAKVQRVLDTLHVLGEGDAFFFVDEAGPWQVKKYGGKALTPSGKPRKIPSRQPSRGTVRFIGGLEVLSNQLTWRFLERKNSAAVIALLSDIREKYKDRSKLYLTWDAVGFHTSGKVFSWLAEANKQAETEGSSPVFEVVPLPSHAQFLNVIEAVFSGMKKAVVSNSDYGSKEEMEAAIGRHFEERNAFYKKNPKRAGNKIWDAQAFSANDLPGGLYRKM